MHDEKACRCDYAFSHLGNHGTLEGLEPEQACPCQCKKCFEARKRLLWNAECFSLAQRLEKGNVNIAALASLVWLHLEGYLEPMVDRRVDEKCNERLHDLVLVSYVRDNYKRQPDAAKRNGK